jgi:O-antigen ligase
MPPDLALLLGAIFIYYAFRVDRQRHGPISRALIWPTIWYLVTSSHPFGYWMELWNIPIPGGTGDPTEGSVIDRFFYGVLTAIGLWILSRRDFSWRETFRNNPWLTALLVYMAASILWSHYPYVSLKRYVKVFGSIVMACVILTEPDPLAAFSTVIRRCLYVHLPMSIICVKYFRDIGVSFGNWGSTSQEWVGIATSKNVLGQVAMVGVLFFFWEVRRNWKSYGWKNIDLLFLLMAVNLLKGSEQSVSMTSISVTLFALLVFIRLQSLRSHPMLVGPFVKKVFYITVGLICMVLIHSVVMFPPHSIFGRLISLLGRDITLTGRTDIWRDVYAAASGDPMFGVGFGGFWIGRLENIPWNAHMTWVLGQGHSGYVDTYLQLGYVGALLLAAVLVTSMYRLVDSVSENFDFACLKITLFLTIIFVDMTESVYLRGDHHLWLILMIVLWRVPKSDEEPATEISEADEVNERAEGIEAIPSWK